MAPPTPAESYLLELPRFAVRGAAALNPGLERIEALLNGMERPHDGYPSVLVAGTNGKGSVASMLAAIMTASGRKVGLHTSPHLFSLRERMRIDGVPAPEEWLQEAVSQHRALVKRTQPSFFEAMVALSLLYFAECEVDFAVVEVGLGGRLDATNILEPQLCLVTRIALDHDEILGPGLDAIAREKAGIARQGVPLLTSADEGSARDALIVEASSRGAEVETVRESVSLELQEDGWNLVLNLVTPVRKYADVRIGLPGHHQGWNAALAIRAAEYLLGSTLEPAEMDRSIRRGLDEVRSLAGLRGRCEVVSENPLVMVDVGHNSDALAAALDTFRQLAPGAKTVIIGLMRDKHPEDVARLLAQADLTIVCVDLPGERALTRKELRSHLEAAEANVIDTGSVDEAVGRFHRHAEESDGLLATGSHQVVAEALAAMTHRAA